jgi:hypothetical protein
MSEEKQEAIEKTEQAVDVLAVLKEIRDMQRQSLERQAQFLWIVLPIFAILCVQTILELIR